MRIGELARRAGVTVKAVRYYESLGLVVPDRRPNGYRDYGEHDVRLVREIKSLAALGIPVERTRPFLDCLAAGEAHADDCPAALAGYRDAIDELTRRIDALTARRAVLTAHLHAAAHRTGTSRPAREPEHNPDERARTGPGTEGEARMTTPMSADHPAGAGPARRTREELATLPPDLPVPEDDGAADHLPGLALPPAALPATDGSTVRTDDLGPGRTVLYFFPLIGTPETDLPEGWDTIPGARGCTPETCGFRDHHRELREAGAQRVFGLSVQGTAYLREVAERLRLPFAMVSDTALTLAHALRMPVFEAGGSTLYRRQTLIVRDGRIEHVFHPVFPPDAHAGQVLDWLRANPA
ncbi:MerR family transcriptional regulator [Streptomyces cacaoi]|uniref:MerR family transcriptional regulator n=1 Tax=Streptomyces cacaoi TaxID=1898 RepID=UPI00262618DB|nr:MerR family transcriptional regulator [Streptomyces cacaoi]